jgi:hypothetical protein
MVNLAVKFHEHGNWARIISHFLFNMKNCYAAESAFYLLRTFQHYRALPAVPTGIEKREPSERLDAHANEIV